MGCKIRDDNLEKVKALMYFKILIDETTDIATVSEIIVYVQFLEDRMGCTVFLSVLPLKDGKAETIFNAQITFIEEHGLDIQKMCAFGSNGASVMLGCENGVAARLRNFVPHLINNHCVAHKLALAVRQASRGIPYLLKF
ncbi:E3 SUMO-protein ligase KIAA1586-like [Dreissena polymorpha]|uniref:E3 SUMO-protein ligase KIAA1586-like n=1 Tax=Dreissena polymorpha TaxID=45954 RepID=UPI0022646675|nr:E3 SUMO-protein ligase KIAA1586-like [Dreissena polymorpha]